jgi:hypothetical protein
METKFIEGTNKQYSIREDGVVIQHYKFTWAGNIAKSFKEKELIACKYPSISSNAYFVRIQINKKQHNVFINSLLITYFNKAKCPKCNVEYKRTIKKVQSCPSCLKKNHRDKNIEYKKNCVLHYSKLCMTATNINISEELYNLHKQTLKIKRLLSEKTGLHFNNFK